MKEKFSGKNIMLIAGSIISFCIGSGFATGQEVMQFFTAYGMKGLIGGLLTALLYVYVCVSVIHVGKTVRLRNNNDIFTYYCGRYLGRAFEWYNLVLTFLIYIVMLAGAGSIFSDYFGMPVWAGRTLMAAASLVSVVFGLNRLVDILGRLGPIIIIGCLLVALAGFFSNPAGLATADAYLAEHHGVILEAAGNWWIAGILYATYLAMPLSAFVVALANSAKTDKEGRFASLAGAGAFGIAVVIVALGELANLPLIADSNIPLLLIAGKLIPALGAAFSVILICGIYSTACPLLWTVASKFAEDGTRKFSIITIGTMFAAYVISFLPFRTLVNFVYGNGGWLAIAFLVCMVIKQIRVAMGDDNTPAEILADNQASTADAASIQDLAPAAEGAM